MCFLKLLVFLQAIRHEKLNLPNSPCEASLEYDFGKCVERSVMVGAGYQTSWSRVVVDGLPLCDNSTLLEYYSNAYFEAMGLGRNELIERTGCLMPCTFMEYKVQVYGSHLLNQFIIFRRREN